MRPDSPFHGFKNAIFDHFSNQCARLPGIGGDAGQQPASREATPTGQPSSANENSASLSHSQRIDDVVEVGEDLSSVPSLGLSSFIHSVDTMEQNIGVESDLRELQELGNLPAEDPKQIRARVKESLNEWFSENDHSVGEHKEWNGHSQDNLDFVQLALRLFDYTDEENNDVDEQQNPILVAADYGDSKGLKKLVEWGENLEAKDSQGLTPAMLVCRSGIQQAVEEAYQMGADFKVKTRQTHDSVMHITASNGVPATIRYLSSIGIPVDEPNRRGETPLHQACIRDRNDNVATLLELKANPFLTTGQGATAFHAAAANGSIDSLNELASRLGDGFDVDIKTGRHGETALMLASEGGHDEVVEWLLDRGANPDLRDKRGETAAFKAAHSGQNGVLRILHDNRADLIIGNFTKGQEGPLHAAASEGHAETVRLLVRLGVPVDSADALGRTAAQFAASTDSKMAAAVIDALVELGLDIDQSDVEGLTPLHRGAALNNLPAVRTLSYHGASLTSRTTEGFTPLDYAAFYHAHKTSKFLVTRGTGVNYELPKGNTTLHVAAGAGNVETLKLMSRQKVDFNVKNDNQQAPPQMAKTYGHPLTSFWLDQMTGSLSDSFRVEKQRAPDNQAISGSADAALHNRV